MPVAHPVLVLDDVVSYGGQRGPFAVVGGADRTALMGLELTNCEGQTETFWLVTYIGYLN